MSKRWNAGHEVKPGLRLEDDNGWEPAASPWWAAEPQKVIVGTPADDTLRGSHGDDTIDGAEGADRMVGREGNDTYLVDNLGDVVRERAHEGIDTVVASVDWTLGKHVENLTLSGSASLQATGNGLNNLITDNAGSNVLNGLDGNDTLSGGHVISPSNVDKLIGGDGDDTVTAGLQEYSHDLLYGGNGNDTISVTRGSNTLYGNDGDDLLVAGSGGIYHGDADHLYGGTGQDTLQGGAVMDGGDGNDQLETYLTRNAQGGAGNDTIHGLVGGGYDDGRVDGGIGDDSIDVYAPMNKVFAYGGDGNDTITGEAGSAVLVDGGAGDDHVTGRQDNSSPSMTVLGGDGNDTVVGYGHGDYVLSGGNGDDRINAVGTGFGTAHASGDAGNDTLSASHGINTLEGGTGDDVFLLGAKEVRWEEMIYIADFESGIDHLSLSQSTLAVGDGDLQVEGAVTVNGPGGFGASAELVIVAADIFGDLTLDAAAAAIGSADQAYAEGQTVLFMVDNGTDSLALYFTSSGNDAQVSAAELSIVGHLSGTASTGAEDIVWGV